MPAVTHALPVAHGAFGGAAVSAQYEEVLKVLRFLKDQKLTSNAETLFIYTEESELVRVLYQDARKQHEEIAATLPIGFYPDEKLSSRVRIMRQHWEKLEPLMQENTKLKRVLLHCLRQFGQQMDPEMSAQIAKIIHPL